MAWLAVDKDGEEGAYQYKPIRIELLGGTFVCEDGTVVLPKGTIEKLIGYSLTWEDEPVEIKEIKQ